MAPARTKISETPTPTVTLRKNLSDMVREAIGRYANTPGKILLKPVSYFAENVFNVTTKTVDARLHDGQFTYEELGMFLRHTKDVQLAAELKAEIDEWVKP